MTHTGDDAYPGSCFAQDISLRPAESGGNGVTRGVYDNLPADTTTCIVEPSEGHVASCLLGDGRAFASPAPAWSGLTHAQPAARSAAPAPAGRFSPGRLIATGGAGL